METNTENKEVNNNNDKNNEAASKSKYPTSIMLFLRVFIGGYLRYLAYQLISTTDTSMSMPVKYGFCSVFIIAGLGLIILSLKMMIKGQYQGGFGDVSEDDEIEEKSDN